MKENLILNLKRRFDSCQSEANIPRSVLDELEKYVVPYRGRMFQKHSGEGSVEWDKYDHYDDTAVVSAQILSASIHGAILPPVKWFDLKFKNEDLQNDDEASEWLADTSRRVYGAIDNSNFDLEADEMILDLTGFGHGFMVSEAGGLDEEELSFDMIPIKEMFFEEGAIGAKFRRLEWTPTKIVSKFGIDNVPKEVKDKYDNPNTTSSMKMEVIFAIFYRKDKKDADTTKPLIATERPWGHIYFLYDGMEQIGDEGGYYEDPVYSVRWRTVSGSQWGHGPGHIALGDIKQLNQHRLMRTRAVEKVIDPANITTQRGLIGNLDLGPRGLTIVRNIDDLKPYESGANFAVSREELELLRNSIRQAFLVDQLELKQSPTMTATEVQVRYELMNRLLGPTAGRMKVDWLNKVVENVFRIELRAGRLLEMPESLKNVSLDINIEYIGALATAQKSQLSNEMINWAGDVANLSQAYPNMKYVVNAEELVRAVGRLKNIPEKAINGTTEVEKLKREEADIIAKRQQLEEAKAEGDAMEAQGKGQQALRAVNENG